MVTVYIGTYTRGPLSGDQRKSQGIYRARFDPAGGALSDLRLSAICDNPSYLALHPNGKVLYAVNEVDDFHGERSGAVSAFAIEPSGALRLLNQLPSHGADPCHLSLGRSGRLLFVANYHGSSVASYHLNDDGKLRHAATVVHQGAGPHPNQTSPHPHYAAQAPAGGLLYVADLGLDQVRGYRVNEETGDLTSAEPPHVSTPAGGGPRHLAFHPGGNFVYVNNELSSAITALALDPQSGAMREVQTITTVPADFAGRNDNAEVLLTRDGKFLYVSNRGHDSLALFAVDGVSGQLSARGHVSTGGACPRDFKLDPGGRFLLAENQRADNIVVFRINPTTGALQNTGHTLTVPTPVCLVWSGGR